MNAGELTVPINSPVPRLWERFGLKTPMGLTGLRTQVQPVTLTENNINEIASLRYNDSEGTFHYTFFRTDPTAGVQDTAVLKANPGLYHVQFISGITRAAVAPVPTQNQMNWEVISQGSSQTLYLLRTCVSVENSVVEVILYMAQSWNVRNTIINDGLGTYLYNVVARKIQGADTLDVGRTTTLDMNKALDDNP